MGVFECVAVTVSHFQPSICQYVSPLLQISGFFGPLEQPGKCCSKNAAPTPGERLWLDTRPGPVFGNEFHDRENKHDKKDDKGKEPDCTCNNDFRGQGLRWHSSSLIFDESPIGSQPGFPPAASYYHDARSGVLIRHASCRFPLSESICQRRTAACLFREAAVQANRIPGPTGTYRIPSAFLKRYRTAAPNAHTP